MYIMYNVNWENLSVEKKNNHETVSDTDTLFKVADNNEYSPFQIEFYNILYI